MTMSEQRFSAVEGLEQVIAAGHSEDVDAILKLLSHSYAFADSSIQEGEIANLLSVSEAQYIYLTFFEKLRGRISSTIEFGSQYFEARTIAAAGNLLNGIKQCLDFSEEGFGDATQKIHSPTEFKDTQICALLNSPNEEQRRFAINYLTYGTEIKTLEELIRATSDTQSAVTGNIWLAFKVLDAVNSAAPSDEISLETVKAEIEEHFNRALSALEMATDGLAPFQSDETKEGDA